MADQFEVHRKLVVLAAQHAQKEEYAAAIVRHGIKIDADNPICGFYRLPGDNPASPDAIGIYYPGGGAPRVIARNNKPTTLESVWHRAVWMPVSRAYYDAKLQTGHWPDEDTLTALLAQPDPDWRAEGLTPPAGDNAPPVEPGSPEDFARKLAIAEANIPGAVTSDDELKAAQAAVSAVAALRLAADKRRKELQEPHNRAYDAIQATWQPLVKGFEAVQAKIVAVQNEWVNEKTQRRLAEEAEARRKQREAEEAAAAANLPPPPPPPPPAPPPAPVAFRGATGKVKREVEVDAIDEDTIEWPTLAAYYSDDPRVRALLLKFAQHDLNENGTVAEGCNVKRIGKVA